MMFHYKNKGILVLVYLFVCIIAAAILINVLKNEIGGPFNIEYDNLISVGVATIVAGFWTYKTRDSYYVANGVKKRMFEDNSFYFIPMEIWAYTFFGGGALTVLFGVLSVMGYLEG